MSRLSNEQIAFFESYGRLLASRGVERLTSMFGLSTVSSVLSGAGVTFGELDFDEALEIVSEAAGVVIEAHPDFGLRAMISSMRNRGPGIVYILSNPKMPGLLKIGMTRRDVKERMRELSSGTAAPAAFRLVMAFNTERPVEHEAAIHEALAEHRLDGREFFSVDEITAITTCHRVIGDGQ